jgi:hypothetical protein
VEVTVEEVRAHLGVETQRQWAYWAILRTTSARLALFSLVTALARQLQTSQPLTCDQLKPTSADALALLQQQLWHIQTVQTSREKADVVKAPRQLFNPWSD